MNKPNYVKKLSKHEMKMIAKMRGIKVKKSMGKTDLFKILKILDKIGHNESPFKSIITDIRNNLPKRGLKLIKNGIKYAEEMNELTGLQVKSFKENLIKFKNGLIVKNRINNRIKEDFDSYSGKNKFKGAKDIRYLFNEEEDLSAHEDIRCLFNGFDYIDIKPYEINSYEAEPYEVKSYNIEPNGDYYIKNIKNKFNKLSNNLVEANIKDIRCIVDDINNGESLKEIPINLEDI